MQRKLAAKIFTVNQFKVMFETEFSSNISSFTGLLAAKQGQIVDLQDFLHRYFMDSFAKIAFGIELGSLVSFEPIPFAIAFDRIQRILFRRFMNPIFKITESFDPSIKKDIVILRKFGMDIIKERRLSTTANNDLLQLFIEYDDGNLSDESLCDQILNFLFAGRDSTYYLIIRSQALSWAFFCLSQNPSALARLLEEIDKVLGDDLYPSYDQLRELKYAKAVFYETLRLYPSVHSLGRMCANDDVLPNGVEIKKGWAVVWDNRTIARLEHIWGPDAAKFNPERFLTKTHSSTKYTAFLSGPRACLGKTLAELQGVFVLVSILKQFTFEVVDPLSVVSEQSITLPMKNGLKCTFKLRS